MPDKKPEEYFKNREVREYIRTDGHLDPTNLPPGWFLAIIVTLDKGEEAEAMRLANSHPETREFVKEHKIPRPKNPEALLSQEALARIMSSAQTNAQPAPAVEAPAQPAQTVSQWQRLRTWTKDRSNRPRAQRDPNYLLGSIFGSALIGIIVIGLLLWAFAPRVGSLNIGAGGTNPQAHEVSGTWVDSTKTTFAANPGQVIDSSAIPVGCGVPCVGHWVNGTFIKADTSGATPAPGGSSAPSTAPSANPTEAPTVTPTPAATGTASPTETPSPTSSVVTSDIGTNFNPNHDPYEQSCAKEIVGGCTWHVGIEGNLWDEALHRTVAYVGIVKGVSISWNGLNDNQHGRCQLVILNGNSTFLNFHIVDGNVSKYKIWAGDVAGWTRTLALQAMQEQMADHQCMNKTFEEIPQWGSAIASPPCGVMGFKNCGSGNAPSSTPTPSGNTSGMTDNNGQLVKLTGKENDTHGSNGMVRRMSINAPMGVLKVNPGESAEGTSVKVNGKEYGPCYILVVTSNDVKVGGGTANFWNEEVLRDHLHSCGVS